ncbi:MAG TPA: hypothetical protein VHV78_14030 [Gemmatimonadaceae bacterium]|jgi:hypothetical protein|nr:hypothetical protein [Gemmatimonadaceae bacterium]
MRDAGDALARPQMPHIYTLIKRERRISFMQQGGTSERRSMADVLAGVLRG